MKDHDPPLGPAQHAALFAWIAQQILAHAGDARGEAIVRSGVRRYGHERGRRMAQRALAAGHPLDMTHYLAYGEWRAAPGESVRRLLVETPDAHMEIVRCPWHGAWQALEMTPLGRLYCEEIDLALVRGFDPALVLEVKRLLTAGAPCCEFVFRGANLTQAVEMAADARTVMPWGYHLGHLYWTFHQVVAQALGEEGLRAMQAALAVFEARYGAAAAAEIKDHQATDFAKACM